MMFRELQGNVNIKACPKRKINNLGPEVLRLSEKLIQIMYSSVNEVKANLDLILTRILIKKKYRKTTWTTQK